MTRVQQALHRTHAWSGRERVSESLLGKLVGEAVDEQTKADPRQLLEFVLYGWPDSSRALPDLRESKRWRVYFRWIARTEQTR